MRRLKESWVNRDYKKGDEQQILGLFAEVFHRELSLAFWKWRFIDNPFGQGIIKLLFDNNKLIGHYAVVPIKLQVLGKPLQAVYSMTTMIHPDYTKQGIFTYLAEETYKTCQEKGFGLVYGFPNGNSYYGFINKLGWQCNKMTILEKELPTTRTNIASAIGRSNYFDGRFDGLWNRVKHDYDVIVPRTTEFLNWRYAENPSVKYQTYYFKDEGYIILKLYAGDSSVKGHIVDILAGDEIIIRTLLAYAYKYFLDLGIRDISCWMTEGSLYSNILAEEGFVKKETETYFGYRMFNEEQLGKWFLTMGDSDVF